MPRKELKSSLHKLKILHASPSEIRYVVTSEASPVTISLRDYDIHIQKNFWSYVKVNFNKNASQAPTFNSLTCTQIANSLFRCGNTVKSFPIPNWMLHLARPSIQYDLPSPSYQQTTKVIGRMKASGSPCPQDKIFVTPLK